MTTATEPVVKKRKPTQSQVLTELAKLRIAQMEQENLAAQELRAKEEVALADKLRPYIVENITEIAPKLVFHISSYRPHAEMSFSMDDKDVESWKVLLPEHLRKELARVAEIDVCPHGNTRWIRVSDVKAKIKAEIEASDPESLIQKAAAKEAREAEKIPVVTEYLSDFLANLTKVTKARERLTGQTS